MIINSSYSAFGPFSYVRTGSKTGFRSVWRWIETELINYFEETFRWTKSETAYESRDYLFRFINRTPMLCRSSSVRVQNFDFSGDEYQFFFCVGDGVNTRCRTRLSGTRILSEAQEKSNRCFEFNLISGWRLEYSVI